MCIRKIYAIFIIVSLIIFQITASANDNVKEYKIYNNGKYIGISSIMRSYSNPDDKPVLYINIKDIYRLGLRVKDIENGISVSNSIKSVDIVSNGESLHLDGYTFNNALISIFNDYLMLDVIGKCFSDNYQSEIVDDVCKIYLEINDPVKTSVSDSIILKSVVFNFNHNICSINMENQTYNGFENVNMYTAYYKKDGTLLDLDVKRIYSIEAKEEFTTLIPLSDCFDDAVKIKIMIWDGRGIPIADVLIPKAYKYDSSLTPPENFEDREILFTDIEVDNALYDAIYVLNNNFSDTGMFKGYEDGTYKANDNILKSEFSYTVTKMTGIDLNNIDIDYNFIDVSDLHWGKKGIAYSVSKGYLSDNCGYFYPNNYITLDEVLSTFLKILGEKEVTPETIINLSEKHNLLKNVDIEEIEVTRGNFAQLAYNFMEEYDKMFS